MISPKRRLLGVLVLALILFATSCSKPSARVNTNMSQSENYRLTLLAALWPDGKHEFALIDLGRWQVGIYDQPDAELVEDFDFQSALIDALGDPKDDMNIRTPGVLAVYVRVGRERFTRIAEAIGAADKDSSFRVETKLEPMLDYFDDFVKESDDHITNGWPTIPPEPYSAKTLPSS